MLKAEQVPDEVFEAFQKAWAVTSTLSTKECLAAAINAWPGMPCSAANCENSMATPDRLPSMPKHILDQDAEIKMYRKTLRDIVRQCNNSGYGSPAVMERMIDRIEDMAIDVLGDAPKKSRTKAEGWEGL